MLKLCLSLIRVPLHARGQEANDKCPCSTAVKLNCAERTEKILAFLLVS